MNLKNIGVGLLLGTLLLCAVLGNPVAKKNSKYEILFEEADVVHKDKKASQLTEALRLGKEILLLALAGAPKIEKRLQKAPQDVLSTDHQQQSPDNNETLNDEDPDEPNELDMASVEVGELYDDLLKLATKLGLDSKRVNSILAKNMNVDTKKIETLLQAEKNGDDELSVKSLDALVKVIEKLIDDLSLAEDLNMHKNEVDNYLETDVLLDSPENI